MKEAKKIPFTFSWRFCLKSGKGRNTVYKTVLSGNTTTCDFFDVYKIASEKGTEAGIKKQANMLFKCYLTTTENITDLQRIALHAAKIIAGAKKFKGNSTMDKISGELNYILSRISGSAACDTAIASDLINVIPLSCSQETRDFIDEATVEAWAHRDNEPEKLYMAIYRKLHDFIDEERKYNDNLKAGDFDELEAVTASAFVINLPESEIDESGEKALNKAVGSLAERQRAYTVMHYHGFTDNEIAKAFKTTVEAVEVGRRKAQKNILDYITENAPDLLKKIDVRAVYEAAAKRGSVSAKRSLFELEVEANKKLCVR